MKRLFQPLAVAALGLALFSCDKGNEPVNRTNGGELLGEPTRFEMSSSLGAVGIEPLSSNTNKADDELRANLHFRGLNSVAQTTLDAAKFGEGKPLQAHWAVKYAGGYYSEPCPVSKAADLDETQKVQMKKSTVCFIGTNNSTIGGAKIKMYTTTSETLDNIDKSIMMLDGVVEGAKTDQHKLYFADGKSDPNHLIKGLKTTSEFQADRHIPIMTKLEPFAKMQVGGENNNQVKFAPRGSLLGLNIKNTTGEQMIVTKLLVSATGVFHHKGYFDLKQLVDGKPTFVGENGTGELAFPAEGTLADDEQACFYVWGFQDTSKKGEAFKVQIVYKTTASGAEERTRTFTVYAPKSKVNTNEKMFDDGYAYNVVLTVNATNKLGGTAADWQPGDLLTTVLNPLALVAEYDIAKIANTAGTNHTLQFVPNHNIKTKNGGADPENDYTQFQEGVDVGLYTWAEAMRLFGYDVPDNTASIYDPNKKNQDGFDAMGYKVGSGWATLNKSQFNTPKYKSISGQDYHIPNEKEWVAIIPYWISSEESIALQDGVQNGGLQLVVFNNDWASALSTPIRKIGKVAGKTGLADVQIGNDILLATEYDDEYVTKEVGGNFVTYAIRFKGTKYESAWRYEYKNENLTNGGKHLIVKNVMLGQNSSKTLVDGDTNSIATEKFFNLNNSVERVFPVYGYVITKYSEPRGTVANTIGYPNKFGYYWSSSWSPSYSSPSYSYEEGIYCQIMGIFTTIAINGKNPSFEGFPLRPFKKP